MKASSLLLLLLLLLPLQAEAQRGRYLDSNFVRIEQAQLSRAHLTAVQEHRVFSVLLKPVGDGTIIANDGFILYANQEDGEVNCSDPRTACVVLARWDFREQDPPEKYAQTIAQVTEGGVIWYWTCSCSTVLAADDSDSCTFKSTDYLEGFECGEEEECCGMHTIAIGPNGPIPSGG